MQPLGQYIRISKPEVLNKSYFILEPERVQVAKVLDVSPDVKVPQMNNVIFWRGRQIFTKGEYVISIENILMYN